MAQSFPSCGIWAKSLTSAQLSTCLRGTAEHSPGTALGWQLALWHRRWWQPGHRAQPLLLPPPPSWKQEETRAREEGHIHPPDSLRNTPVFHAPAQPHS